MHDWGRELGFSGDFSGVLKRIWARNLKNTVFLIKNIVWRLKKRIFKKNELLKKHRRSKIDLLMKFLDDSAWFCMEKLKKHSFETKKPKQIQKTLKKSQKNM